MQRRRVEAARTKHRLTPAPSRRKSTRRKRHRWYWDVEAAQRDPEKRWDGANLVCLKRADGERVTFRGPSCLARMADFIEANPEIYSAHYGGGYDVPLLLNYWRPQRVVMTGSTILCAEGHGGLALYDTFPRWLAGLGKIGESIGVKKLDVDRSLIERLTPEELEIYCNQDVDVLHAADEICRTWLESYDVDPDKVSTAGTAATWLMRKIDPLSYDILSEHKNRTQMIGQMLIMDGANPGGMTNAYWHGRRRGVHCYDIKSSYPARYATREVPIGLRPADANELARPESFKGIALASYYWPYERRVPVAFDNTTGAGYGHVTSWLVDDEIQILLELGISVRLSKGWCGVEYAPIGQDFARELFAAKEAKRPFSFFPKTFVNSWHGKTGMKPVRDNYDAKYPRKYWRHGGEPRPATLARGNWLWHYKTLGTDVDGLSPWHSQPMISAIVLGRARAALWRINDAFQRAGWHVFYNDTDSVMTDCPPERSPVPLGKDLGMLAYEGGPYDAIFLGAKAYILIDENGAVAKCALKGVPHKSYQDAVWTADTLREARGNERLLGAGFYARKGSGRDQRIELFERALSGSAKAYKEGIRSFKKGLRDLEWKRDSLTREIRSTVTNLVCDEKGFRLLSADEIVF